MKHAFNTTAMALFFGLMLALPAEAFDTRNAYETGDGHWIYFGPAPSGDWTAQRVMPRKRSLARSIRQDALRHYAMPRYELPESGEVIAFYGAKSAPQDKAVIRPVERKTHELKQEVFELPESGQIIRFAKDGTPPAADVTIVAGRNGGPS